jgi:hypothetical protein
MRKDYKTSMEIMPDTGHYELSNGNSRQTWYAPYKLGLMSSAMLPSTTIKFFVPLDFTPVTLLTKQQVLAIRDLPGSMMRVRSRERTNSRTYQFFKKKLWGSHHKQNEPSMKKPESICAYKEKNHKHMDTELTVLIRSIGVGKTASVWW